MSVVILGALNQLTGQDEVTLATPNGNEPSPGGTTNDAAPETGQPGPGGTPFARRDFGPGQNFGSNANYNYQRPGPPPPYQRGGFPRRSGSFRGSYDNPNYPPPNYGRNYRDNYPPSGGRPGYPPLGGAGYPLGGGGGYPPGGGGGYPPRGGGGFPPGGGGGYPPGGGGGYPPPPPGGYPPGGGGFPPGSGGGFRQGNGDNPNPNYEPQACPDPAYDPEAGIPPPDEPGTLSPYQMDAEDALPQFDRNRNIHIHDLPEKEEENIPAIIAKMSELLQIPIDHSDIQAVYRIRANPGKTRPLVIEFTDEAIRNDILTAARRIHLNSKMFYEDEEDRPVYINEPLTRFFRKLLYETKRKASEAGYKFCWYRNARLHVRKDEFTDPINIENFEDLNKIQ